MSDKGFAKRLNEACDGHPHVPAYGHGRQEWIKKQLGVSSEAVRKYAQGLARPKPDKMRLLAKILEVDEAWLSLGITPDLQPGERRVRNSQVEGAVNALVGLLQMNGGNCAFPGDRDPRAAYVDFYAILRGAQFAFHVSLAKEVSVGHYRFIVPKEFDQCSLVGVVHVYPMRLHCIAMPYDLVDRHKVRRGGYYEVTMSKRDSQYFTGKDEWPRINSFANF